ncbi:MAG: hypothetical protein AAF533_20815 [Acidobacteriota bacterium]
MSEPKTVNFVGAELRRLRGIRKLGELASQAREVHAVRIGSAELDEIRLRHFEVGSLTPSTEECFTLSLLHRLSLHEMLDLLVVQQIVDKANLGARLEQLSSVHNQAWRDGDWETALAAAASGEALAERPSDWAAWRTQRAVSMGMLGMGRTALLILMDLSEHHSVEPDQRYQVFRYLADQQVNAGHFSLAAQSAQLAVEHAPHDLAPEWRWGLIHTQVRLFLLKAEQALEVDDEEIHEALFLIRDARRLITSEDSQKWLALDFMEAAAQELLGEQPVSEYERIARDARSCGHRHVEALAWKNLGVIHRRAGDIELAREPLLLARSLAREGHALDELFDVTFELYLLFEERGLELESEQYLAECHLHYQQVHSCTPNLLAYEALLRAAS